MCILAIFLILQLCMVLFAWYRAYRKKEKFWNCIDIRGFWGIALLFNVGGVCLSIYDFKCATSGRYDLVADEMGIAICFFIIQTIVTLIDGLAIYLMTKKYWNAKRILRVGVYVSILTLLIIFEILVSPIYVRHFIFLFIEVNAVPLLASVYVLLFGGKHM